MSVFNWVHSMAFGYLMVGLWIEYIIPIANWVQRKHEDRMIAKIWREGKIIHGPD